MVVVLVIFIPLGWAPAWLMSFIVKLRLLVYEESLPNLVLAASPWKTKTAFQSTGWYVAMALLGQFLYR